MTTDPFTEAALAEADSRAYGNSAGVFCNAFRAGAEWARTHLAAQEPTDAEVLAAMTAYEGHPDRVSAWRAALSAAKGVRNG